MSEVPQVATPTNAADMTGAIADAYRKLEGQNPSGFTLAAFLGLWDLETGAGRFTFNWNVGNLKAVGSQDFYINPRVTGEGNQFAAYDTLVEGVGAWLGLLAKQARYATTWAKARAGDTRAFAQAIEDSGYAGTHPEKPSGWYANPLVGRIQKYLKNVPTTPTTPSTPTEPSSSSSSSAKAIGFGFGVLALASATAAGVWFLAQPRSSRRGSPDAEGGVSDFSGKAPA